MPAKKEGLVVGKTYQVWTKFQLEHKPELLKKVFNGTQCAWTHEEYKGRDGSLLGFGDYFISEDQILLVRQKDK